VALDATPGVEAAPAARAVVSGDGQAIRLTVYREAGPVAAVELEPVPSGSPPSCSRRRWAKLPA